MDANDFQPARIQLSRKKGWRLPASAVKVDRTTKFGNPFKAIDPKDESAVRKSVAYFEEWLTKGEGSFECGPGTGVTMVRIPAWYEPGELRKMLPQLKGKDLACWCKLGAPCHAEVLLRLANGGSCD